MAMFRRNKELNAQEIESLRMYIIENYNVTNVAYVEQSNEYCTYKGSKNGAEYLYKFDKNSSIGAIIEEEVI